MADSKINFWERIFRSGFDFGFYRNITGEKVSASIGYLAKLLLIVTLFLSVRYSYDFGRFADTIMDWFSSNIGKVEIKKGEVIFDKPQPFKVEKLGFTFGVDTTGVTKEVEGETGFLFTKNKFIYKARLGKANEYDLSKVDSFTMDKAFFKDLKASLYWLACLFIFLGVYIYLIIAKLIQVAIFSVFSLLMGAITSANLDYKKLFNIGIYALTPSVVIATILIVLKLNVPNFWIIYSGIYIIFITMGMVNTKEEK